MDPVQGDYGAYCGRNEVETLFTEENYQQIFNANDGLEERKLSSLWFMDEICHSGAMW